MSTHQPIIGRGRFQDLTGRTFGRLTVIALKGKNPSGNMAWRCQCLCGNVTDATTGNLKSGITRSCGCLKRERFLRDCRQTKHGGWDTPEWHTWSGMIQRCHNPNYHHFANYGGRGILVCQRWRDSFEAFLADMGRRPGDKDSIDRIDNDRGYDCGHCEDCQARGATANCRWATAAEQARNTRKSRRITFRGETLTLKEWAIRVGISTPLLHHRLKAGWPIEDALTTAANRSANLWKTRKKTSQQSNG
jgi:hypothetical protein